MPPIPLIRRVLPWLYVLVFLLVGPLLVLYTTGYRYNTVKQRVERNGTLIADSVPTGASVWLDGQDTRETTPVTLQNIVPGWHALRFSKSGYRDWGKSLAVRTDQVTFANQTWLWRAASSTPAANPADVSFATSSAYGNDGSMSLEQTASGLILLNRPLGNRFLLPPGPWRIAAVAAPYALLTHDGLWQAVDASRAAASYADRLAGDGPRWLPNADPPSALFLNRNELWLWQLGSPPTLLWRQTDPLVQAAWHRSGTTVFIAARTSVFALELDDRSGRLVTPLADFDRVYNLAVLDQSLYIDAEKNHRRTVWKLEVE